mgnify:FL=1
MKYRLILSDVDSTLIEQEVIDLLAERSGHGSEVAEITRAAMAGELDFRSALTHRVKLLEGLTDQDLVEVASQIRLAPGALELREFCRSNNIKFGAVTGGFAQVLQHIPFFAELDFLRANSLQLMDGKVTGKVEGEIIDRTAKADFLSELALSNNVGLDQCVAIGDGANDLEMIERAGLGVSFRGKEILNSAADITISRSLAEVISLIQ